MNLENDSKEQDKEKEAIMANKVNRSVYTYEVSVRTMVMVDAETAKLKETDNFTFENVGKATETQMRAAGKALGIKCGKGYKIIAKIIKVKTYAMDADLFMQFAELVDEQDFEEPEIEQA